MRFYSQELEVIADFLTLLKIDKYMYPQAENYRDSRTVKDGLMLTSK